MSQAPMTFEDSVKERMKAIVAELIPEERWTAIVAATVREFEAKDLPTLIKNELLETYKAAIKAEFAKPIWAQRWTDSGALAASEMVQNLITENAHAILGSMMGQATHAVVVQMQAEIARMRGY
jgi:hypothetical protein